MVVYITNVVKRALNNYRNALRRYPISRQRAHDKYNMMVDALLALDKNYVKCPHCIHRKLGQQFDSSGSPIHKNLYRFNYIDSSNFQWAFAFIVDEVNDKITITKMMPARFVTESMNNFNFIITESINNFLRGIVDENRDAKIRRIVRESIDRFINQIVA